MTENDPLSRMAKPIHFLFLQPCFTAGYYNPNQLGKRTLTIYYGAELKCDQTHFKKFEMQIIPEENRNLGSLQS